MYCDVAHRVEGNPDESKVGAFGVGAYTMFSVCEEPLVVSGKKGEEEASAAS